MKKLIIAAMSLLPLTALSAAHDEWSAADQACSELARFYDYNGYYSDIKVQVAKKYKKDIYMCKFSVHDLDKERVGHLYQDKSSFYAIYDVATGTQTKLD
ncbi:hypothetical protein [uncultured Shewanella sp.]|uniref:hypothetical protein n=1 Tax=uncultured Shewanella sp. TaxID=173975 RepID=UPI00260731A6|nr:hypothetical protein [uncultured Shewanella sp.]